MIRPSRALAAPAAVLTALILGGCSSGGADASSGGSGLTLTSGAAASSGNGISSVSRTGGVPAEIVGRWNGGSTHSGYWWYEFYPDGSYRAWPSRDPSSVFIGTVDVAGGTITFSNDGRPVTSTWYTSSGLLFLDGYSYVPA